MALINCPNCNKEISDKSKTCIGCGYLLTDDTKTEKSIIHCPECGTNSDASETNCQNCGCPLTFSEMKNEKPKSIFKKKWFWILTVVIALIILVFFGFINIVRTESYRIDICTAVDEIMAVSADAEVVGNQVSLVWYNAIFDKNNAETAEYTSTAEDFNEALANLYADEEFMGQITTIGNKVNEIDAYFVKLKNPPAKFKDAYDEFKELYNDYYDYVDFVVSCRGKYSLQGTTQGNGLTGGLPPVRFSM